MDSISFTIPLPYGIELKIHWSLTLVLLFIAYMAVFVNPVYLVFVAMYGLMAAHELAHLWAARNLGIDCSVIELNPIGGGAYIESDDNPMHELITALAGPASNLVMGIMFYLIGRLIAMSGFFHIAGAYEIVMILANFNFINCVYNLWPIFPLDGGRILRSLLTMRFDYEKATTFVARFTQVFAAIGIIHYLGGREYFSAVYMLFSMVVAEGELAGMRRRKSIHFLDKYFEKDETGDDAEKDEKFREAMDKVDAVLDEKPEDK